MYEKIFMYTRSQQRGVILLVTIIILLLIVRAVLPIYYETSYEKHVSEYEQYFKALSDSLEKERDRVPELFYFDPNQVVKEELRQLGFSAYQSKNLLSYRKAGGSFKKASDLKKIYGIDVILYDRVSPYIKITKVSKGKNRATSRRATRLNLNKVAYTDLMKLKGISSKLANRIINFRNALGGFYEISQIDEVYGLKTELKGSIKDRFYVSSEDILKLDLSNCNEKDLARHAYIDRKQAKLLLSIFETCKGDQGSSAFYKQLTGNGLGKVIPYL